MSDTLVHGLEAVGTLVGCFVAILIFWMKLSDRISDAKAEADAASKSAAAAIARVIDTEKQLVDHRVMVAAEYVSTEMLNGFRSEVLGAINRLSDQFMSVFSKAHN